ncbi:hypothetical protein [Chryseobacterium sp. Bi04]|uniref:hypothetical protein n=1 Tax=Chryseobacterium sp. Bi04 TaxID=2822345 RepID=UPI001D2F4ED4|nr:hypothetical protein [Chryseobacterium sp. Bi04]CAH0277817.1 hypothetical protein SRABI04_03960 [Chryseobacterium sp. Bi04]
MKLKSIIMFSLISMGISAQVGISKAPAFQPDIRTELHVQQNNEAVRLPRSNTTSILPVSAAGTTGNGTQGSILYNKQAANIAQNDGTQWKVISDPILVNLKNGKLARFVRSGGTLTSSCGTCVLCGAENRQCTPIDVPLTATGNNAFNDIAADVELVAASTPQIRFKTSGLYRISFSSRVTSSAPVCLGIAQTIYARMNLSLQANGTGAFVPINSSVSPYRLNSATDPLQILGILGPKINHSISSTYVGTFNTADIVKFTFFGNQDIVVGGCTGGAMNFQLDGTGYQLPEVIIEKLTM